jgi:hypothetical protein
MSRTPSQNEMPNQEKNLSKQLVVPEKSRDDCDSQKEKSWKLTGQQKLRSGTLVCFTYTTSEYIHDTFA